MSKRVSIHDVAAAASVSITTVSHALNGKGRLHSGTRERVRRIAEEIGYEPSLHARSLASGHSRLLAIQAFGGEPRALVPQVDYFVDLLNGASAAAFSHGYGLILAPPGSSADELRRLPVDGVAIVDPIGVEALRRVLNEVGKPMVTSGRVLGDDNGAWVDSDHLHNAQLVLDHMREMGCERPALLTTRRGASYVEDARRGYRSWCDRHHVAPRIATVRAKPTLEAGARALAQLLDSADPPDAVYATLDSLALGALELARRRGLSVPRDLAVAALTDAAVLRVVTPQVTAFDLHPRRIGERLVETLVALVDAGPPFDEIRSTLRADLIARESTRREPLGEAPEAMPALVADAS